MLTSSKCGGQKVVADLKNAVRLEAERGKKTGPDRPGKR